jgi:hypothetical protein
LEPPWHEKKNQMLWIINRHSQGLSSQNVYINCWVLFVLDFFAFVCFCCFSMRFWMYELHTLMTWPSNHNSRDPMRIFWNFWSSGGSHFKCKKWSVKFPLAQAQCAYIETWRLWFWCIDQLPMSNFFWKRVERAPFLIVWEFVLLNCSYNTIITAFDIKKSKIFQNLLNNHLHTSTFKCGDILELICSRNTF